MEVVKPMCMVPNIEELTMMVLCFVMVSERYKLLQVRIIDVFLVHIKKANLSLMDYLIHSYNGVSIKIFLGILNFLISFLCLSDFLTSAAGATIQTHTSTHTNTHNLQICINPSFQI